jgi:hypothetical protein
MEYLERAFHQLCLRFILNLFNEFFIFFCFFSVKWMGNFRIVNLDRISKEIGV